MGCDIHFYVEHKVGETWKRVPDIAGVKGPYSGEEKTWDPGRHYALFGLLAGVRSNIFSPFIVPRGLPPDISKEVKSEWNGTYHTESYLTLPELLSFQDSIENVFCYLNVSEYKEYKSGKKLDYYDFTHCPSGSEIISNEKMERIMSLSAFLDERRYYTKIDYKVSYKEISPLFWIDIVGAMKELSEDSNNVRCVFWFDS